MQKNYVVIPWLVYISFIFLMPFMVIFNLNNNNIYGFDRGIVISFTLSQNWIFNKKISKFLIVKILLYFINFMFFFYYDPLW